MINVIDYGMGNCGSIGNMLLKLGAEFCIVSEPERLCDGSTIILPGVGSFDNGIKKLQALGFDRAIKDAVKRDGTRFLGICLGMQLLFEKSEEGTSEGLNLIPGEVIKFRIADPIIKIPHMGWSSTWQVNSCRMLDGVFEDSRYYFVHSYHVLCDEKWIVSKAHHGYDFPAVVSSGGVYGAQFHPEKSHKHGLEFLKRFVEADRAG